MDRGDVLRAGQRKQGNLAVSADDTNNGGPDRYTFECAACGHVGEELADRCPACGAPRRTEYEVRFEPGATRTRKVLSVIALVLIVAGMVALLVASLQGLFGGSPPQPAP